VVAAVDRVEEGNPDLETSLSKAHAAYKTLTSFFYMHSISRYVTQDIIKFKLPLSVSNV
jgi:hypothetical protein